MPQPKNPFHRRAALRAPAAADAADAVDSPSWPTPETRAKVGRLEPYARPFFDDVQQAAMVRAGGFVPHRVTAPRSVSELYGGIEDADTSSLYFLFSPTALEFGPAFAVRDSEHERKPLDVERILDPILQRAREYDQRQRGLRDLYAEADQQTLQARRQEIRERQLLRENRARSDMGDNLDDPEAERGIDRIDADEAPRAGRYWRR